MRKVWRLSPGLQGAVITILNADPCLTRVGHGNGQRNQAWSRFDVAHPDAHVPAPDVNNRSAAAVVARVHAEIVLLRESCVQWNQPVRTTLVRAALKRPEGNLRGPALRFDRIAIVVPFENLQLRLPNIRVADIEYCKIGEVVVDDDGQESCVDFQTYRSG